VHREITSAFGRKEVILRETERAVIPFGGPAVFAEYLGKVGYSGAIRRHMRMVLTSPNTIDPEVCPKAVSSNAVQA
jgi:hypothetical protein